MAALNNLKKFYQDFDIASLGQLRNIYAENVVFKDPVHKIDGLEALETYFARICRNVDDCQFTFEHESVSDKTAFFQWVMEFSHPRLRGGEKISIRGCSLLQFDTKVYFHEDFYDLGAMLYEHIPLVGRLVLWLKTRLS